MKQSSKEMREVEVVTIQCDLCGSSDCPKYGENRVCGICGRDTCGKCQHFGEFDQHPTCKVCHELKYKFMPEINETYKVRERLYEQWKKESLAPPSSRGGG